MEIVFGDGAPRIVGLTQAQGFSWAVEETPAAGGTSETSGQVYEDITYTLVDLTGVSNNCRLHVADSYLEPGHSFTSETPEIATVDDDGNVTRVSSGLAEIIISTPRAGSKRFTRQMSTGASSSTSRFEAFADGSLGAHCVAQIKALIAGKTPGAATQRYWNTNSGGVAAPSGSRNASNFAASLDLSGISMCMTGRDTEMFPVTLISSRHAIMARHTVPSVGTQVVFQRADGTYQTVSIVGVYNSQNADLSVVYFATAITGITPFKVLQRDAISIYAPSMHGGPAPYIPHGELPLLRKCMWNPAGAFDSWIAVGMAHSVGTSIFDVSYGLYPTDAEILPWHNAVRGGDSSSPQFVVINGEPILAVVNSAAGASPLIDFYETEINSAMNSLASTVGTYALEHPVLSEFTSYT